ncbi:MAG TPA: hypothetical protein ENG87_05545 [Candidatus Pacearchaeota archaeon]|nr:hypothetical protein BMS3Abin17_00877 [archaeon BMS3Abin17]HDK42821.1 hypothetical protein [Candidatus Pacearchaeota archaeon]HDZ61360.1 hypothetical protein [Candidatus Pacearchaeota archaeon]
MAKEKPIRDTCVLDETIKILLHQESGDYICNKNDLYSYSNNSCDDCKNNPGQRIVSIPSRQFL